MGVHLSLLSTVSLFAGSGLHLRFEDRAGLSSEM